MDNLRLILFISGILVIAAIYAWEVFRERRASKRRLNIFGDDLLEQDDPDAFHADTDARRYPDPSDRVTGQATDRATTALQDEAASSDPDAPGNPNAPDEPFVVPSGDAQAAPVERSSARSREMAVESPVEEAADRQSAGPAPPVDPVGEVIADIPVAPAEKFRPERIRARNHQEKGRAGRNALDKSDDAKGLVLALTIMARPGRRFMGPDIREQFENVGMRFGEMRIFHHFGMDGQRTDQPIFSAADILEPGVFPVGNLENYTARGLVLFMQLPGPLDGLIAFELMLNVAQKVAKALEGELCDDTRSTLTTQAANHLRERIEEMKRKQLV